MSKHEWNLLKAFLEEKALVNKKTKELYIPDVSGQPYKVYGLQIADLAGIQDDELVTIADEYGLLSNYALANYPAPGTCAKNRLGFLGFTTDEPNENADENPKDIIYNYKDFLTRYDTKELISETEYIKELKGE